MSKISENMKLIRLLKGLSVRQVAQRVNRSPGTISNWENGKISPDVDTVEKLCEIYDVTPNELLGWTPCPEIVEFYQKQQHLLSEMEELETQRNELDNRIKAYKELLSRNY